MNEKKNLLKFKWIVLAVVVVAAGWYYHGWNKKKAALEKISGDPALIEMYEKALTREQQIIQNPDSFEYYNAAFFNWKSLGDATKDKYFYKKALKVSNKANKQDEAKSALFYANAATVYKILGDFKNADKNYELAVELNEGDERMWLPYIQLWEEWEQKTPTEVLELYDRALNVLIAKVNVSIAKASYLAKIGDYKQALSIYEAVHVAIPEQPGLAEKIQELKYLMQQ